MTFGSKGLLAASLLVCLGSVAYESGAAPNRTAGWQAALGNGTVTSYGEFDRQGAPTAIGVAFSASALDGLPATSANRHCFNRSAEGEIVAGTKCPHSVEHVIPLPDAVTRRADMPFKWVLLNWNSVGHIPPGVYDLPHFDVHFEMLPIADIFAIEVGPCGPDFVRCDQFQAGKKPIPPNYVPADYHDIEAVVPAMGNHLIDLTGAEFNKQPFTRSFIYGAYDGRIVFYEEMVARAYLLSKPDACAPIKTAKAVATDGFYPTVSCVRHDARTGEYSVSLERFVLRKAAAPEPVAAK